MNKISHFASFRMIMGLSLTLLCSLLSYGAYSWASYTNHLTLSTIHISGNKITSTNDYSNQVSNLVGSSIFQVDEKTIRMNLEKEHFIQAARISRHFPNTLNIELIERIPIAMLNTNPIMFIDEFAVVLPGVEKALEQNLPILSGFNETKNLFPLGKLTLSSKVREVIRLITHIKNQYPFIYQNISEFRLNLQDEYELILLEKPTFIMLGIKDFYKKLQILDQFQKTLSSKRKLTDYSKIDLRYKNQVVVKERHR